MFILSLLILIFYDVLAITITITNHKIKLYKLIQDIKRRKKGNVSHVLSLT